MNIILFLVKTAKTFLGMALPRALTRLGGGTTFLSSAPSPRSKSWPRHWMNDWGHVQQAAPARGLCSHTSRRRPGQPVSRPGSSLIPGHCYRAMPRRDDPTVFTLTANVGQWLAVLLIFPASAFRFNLLVPRAPTRPLSTRSKLIPTQTTTTLRPPTRYVIIWSS